MYRTITCPYIVLQQKQYEACSFDYCLEFAVGESAVRIILNVPTYGVFDKLTALLRLLTFMLCLTVILACFMWKSL